MINIINKKVVIFYHYLFTFCKIFYLLFSREFESNVGSSILIIFLINFYLDLLVKNIAIVPGPECPPIIGPNS